MADFRGRHAAQPVDVPEDPPHGACKERIAGRAAAVDGVTFGHTVGARFRDSAAPTTAFRGSASRSGALGEPGRGPDFHNRVGSVTTRSGGDPAGTRASRPGTIG